MAIDRVALWQIFGYEVELHIEKYVEPQYENDAGDAQYMALTYEECCKQAEKYLARRKSNMRGNVERVRDLMKVAHFMQMAHDKLLEELEMDSIYKE